MDKWFLYERKCALYIKFSDTMQQYIVEKICFSDLVVYNFVFFCMLNAHKTHPKRIRNVKQLNSYQLVESAFLYGYNPSV